jgi:hypothetical protein
MQTQVPLPPNVTLYTGLYSNTDPIWGTTQFEVFIKSNTLYAAFTDGKSAFQIMNLTQIDDFTFHLQQLSPNLGKKTRCGKLMGILGCRWDDDSYNFEYVYFTMDEDMTYCTAANYGETNFAFESKQCPQC